MTHRLLGLLLARPGAQGDTVASSQSLRFATEAPDEASVRFQAPIFAQPLLLLREDTALAWAHRDGQVG